MNKKLLEGNFSKLRNLVSQEGMTSSTFRIPINSHNKVPSSTGSSTAIVKMYGGFPRMLEGKFDDYESIFKPMQAELQAYEKLKDLQGDQVPKLFGHGYMIATEADYKGWCILMEDVGVKRPNRTSFKHYQSAKHSAQLIHDRGVAGVVTLGSMGLRDGLSSGADRVVFYDFAQTQSQKFKYLYLNDLVYLSRIFSKTYF